MSFLLDTDTCSAVLRQDRRIFSRFVQHAGRMYISDVGLSELYAWVYPGVDPQDRIDAIGKFLGDVDVLKLDDDTAERFCSLRSALRPRGVVVPVKDLLIATTALVHNLTLVTHNTRHFKNVPGLSLDDWLAP